MNERIFIALGTNLGDRAANLARARMLLEEQVSLVEVSSIYETKPWGFTDQPDFLNQVVEGVTELTPTGLLNFLKRIEKVMGREENFRNGPRVIDLDILLFGKRIVHTTRLNIPHATIPERAFVLIPLAEIAPDLVHPQLGKTITELLTLLSDQEGIRKWG